MTETTRDRKNVIVLILGALMTVSPFSIDMYLPAFSQIAKDFGTTTSRISLSVASYFAGLAIGQLLYGPLLDRFGRKKPLYTGLIIYILTSIACSLAQSADMLIAIRFLQALGGCVAMVAAVAMVRDFFPVQESPKIFSLLMLILGLSPMLAPTIGGFITVLLGWQWVFIALAVIALLILIITIAYLPEGHKPDASISLKAKPMMTTFAAIFKDAQFSTYSFAGAFSFASMFVYVAGSPVIFLEIFHVSPQAYGGIFALLSIGFVGGNQLNILLLRKYSSEQIFSSALVTQVVSSIIFVTGTYFGWFDLIATIVLFFVSLSCLGLTYPNASALALAPFSKNAGSASALIGALQIGIAGLASGSVGLFNANDRTPIILMLFITSLIALLILFVGKKRMVVLASETEGKFKSKK